MNSEHLAEVRVSSADVTLPVTGVHRGEDGFHHIVCAGRSAGEIVGFEVVLVPGWFSQRLDASLSLHFGTVRILSLGRPSDAFVRLLDKEYGTDTGCSAMQPVTEYTAVTLGGDPQSLQSGAVKIKLFFEGDGDKLHAQMFLYIDLPSRTVRFVEKEPGFRRSVVLALAPPRVNCSTAGK